MVCYYYFIIMVISHINSTLCAERFDRILKTNSEEMIVLRKEIPISVNTITI